MRLYLDSSALVKAFIAEPGRDAVLASLQEASTTVTSRLAYVECLATFARRARAKDLTAAQHRRVEASFEDRWRRLGVIEIDTWIANEAAALTKAHPLRAADAIHLASALLIAADEPARVTFACWDGRLREAAQVAGLDLVPATV